MKAIFSLSCLLISSWLISGCDPGYLDEAAQQSACRIQKITINSVSELSEQKDETNFEYNADGNLTKKTYVQNLVYKTGIGNKLYSVTETYAYDSDGFLTTSASETSERTTAPNNVVNTLQRSSTTTYSYTDGRLTGYQLKEQNGYGVTTNTKAVLAYDEKGELLTKTHTRSLEFDSKAPETPTSSDGQTIWTYKNQQLVDYVDKIGGSESRPYTLENGLVTRMLLVGRYLQLNAYDSQRRLVKNEEFFNDKLARYYTQEWSNAQPATSTLPTFKGHPVTQPEFGEPGVLSKHIPYSVNQQTSAVQQILERTSTPRTNAQGLIESATGEIRQLHPDALPQRTTITESYLYTNCN